ncbi:MAG: chorismate synthase, partial [Bacteroidetes bacterium]|nr:chorismate synthase [Bacteroidota bacterium]
MNAFGKLFKLNIFGESHGTSVGIVIDGCPAGLPLEQADFEADFSRRKSGAKGTTPRQEPDTPSIMSGLFNGRCTGAPLMILFENTNTRSGDYSHLKDTPRPGHADFTGAHKFGGYQDYRGGGHFSGRLTLGLVAAGVVAKKMIAPAIVSSSILEVGGSSDIEAALDRAIENRDSIGGIIECSIASVPAGLGEPFFDSV